MQAPRQLPILSQKSTHVYERRGFTTFAAPTANGKDSRKYSMTEYVLGLERP